MKAAKAASICGQIYHNIYQTLIMGSQSSSLLNKCEIESLGTLEIH